MANNAEAHKQGQGEECGLQEKELGHVRSNLHSLKKLYGLLNVEENDPKSISSQNLDEKARSLLKKLLDGATEQALESHSKIISGQLDASLASMDLVRPGNQENPEKNFPRQDPELSCHSITRKEDDQSHIKQISQETIRGETGKFEFTATQSLHKRSGSRICQKCNRKRPNSAKVKKNSNTSEKQKLKQGGEIRVGSEPSYGILVDESDKNAEKVIDVSKEVEQAIQRIEAEIYVDQSGKVGVSIDDRVRVGSMIQKKDMATQTTEVKDKTDKKKSKDTSLQGQLVSQTRHAVGTSRSLPRQRMSQASRKIKEPCLPDPLLSQARKAVVDANELPSQMRIRINRGGMASPDPSKAGKSIKEKNELPSRLMSQEDLTMSQSRKQPIHEMLVSSNQNARKRKEIHKDQRERNSEIGTSQPSKPPLVVGPTLMRNESLNPHPKDGKTSRNLEKLPKSKQGTISKRDLPRQIIKRPNFRDATAGPTRSKGSSYQAWGGTHKERALRSTLLPHPQKVKVIRAKDDSDSSLLTSQDTYTDKSEDPPIYDEMGPTTSEDSYTSESEGPPIYRQVEPTSRRYVPDDHIRDNSYAHASASTPDRKGHPRGRWRKFKDKLAIVFHHHHHHHHHHNSSNSSDESQIRHVTPNHNRHQSVNDLRQIIHRPRKEDHKKLMAEIYGERVAKRTSRQHQQGQFHALLDGFLRHVWQSKKSKPSVAGIERMGKVPKCRRAAKKLHWWQKFRKRGVKLASGTKPRIKLGFKTRRPHLEAGKL